MTTADKQILFACTQNAVRSVIAKGLFETKSYSPAGRAVSCGVIEGPLDGFVVAVLRIHVFFLSGALWTAQGTLWALHGVLGGGCGF